MRAGFNYAVRYWAEVTCVSPLRTGGAEQDLEQVLRRWDGTPYLQGSSLAGALRDWRNDEELFGSREREGQLIVSDLEFSPDAAQGTRPRLHIDGTTGTGADGGKFDVSALLPGTTGSFTLVWQGKEPPEPILPVLESYLAALDAGHIRLGGQRSNGFGRVSLSVRRRRYDMRNPEDLTSWLEDAPANEAVALDRSGLQDGAVTFQVTARLHRLLVKAAAPAGVGQGSIDAPPMEENCRLLLPGSSIKGAVRAHISRIAPFCLGGDSGLRWENFLGRGCEPGRDNGIAGKAWFSDGAFEDTAAAAISRIRINRITGGVLNKALFTEQPVTATVKWSITAPEAERAGCALLLYALRDLGLGLYTLGSGGSIGHGLADWVRVEIHVPGQKTAVLDSRPEAVRLEDPEGVVSGWLDACKEVRT